MPVISMFYEIIIRLYFYDKGKHSVAHINAEYGEFEVSFEIRTGEILSSSITNKKIKLVQAWMEIHQEKLIADWNLASKGDDVFEMKPLR
jgi:hypothetical protein